MPRANRHFIPEQIWHITHRCHGREYLLKDVYDRQQWLMWLRKARERYKITVLGYCVTCNHIHLMVEDTGPKESISRAMQLVQGRMGQLFNERTGRINAFGVTAIMQRQLSRVCICYAALHIDLNMVRAGVVSAPGDWRESSYHEIHDTRVREGIIDSRRLAALLGCSELESLRKTHFRIIDETLQNKSLVRDTRWSESIAVESKSFVSGFTLALGERLKGRTISSADDIWKETFVVSEPSSGIYYEGTSPETTFLAGDNLVKITFDNREV